MENVISPLIKSEATTNYVYIFTFIHFRWFTCGSRNFPLWIHLNAVVRDWGDVSWQQLRGFDVDLGLPQRRRSQEEATEKGSLLPVSLGILQTSL